MARKGNADRLLSLIERIERLEEERKQLAEDVKDIFAEAKSAGFDPKVMKQMIKERKLSPSQREEWSALCDMYRAALGMLDGTPLGEHARKRFERKPEPPAAGGPDAAAAGGAPGEGAEAAPGEDAPAAPAEPSAEDLLKARAEGAAAAKAGRKVVENPYAAGDRRRAAWDEGWCAASASDGMDIPDAWRRSTPKKPAKGDGKGA